MSSFEPYQIYWKLYGGLCALLKSPYLYVSAGLTWLCEPFWGQADLLDGRASAQAAVEIIPSLMAFSMGGMAILLAFTGSRFMNAIRQNGKNDSLFMEIVANFFHFLLCQILALVGALASKTFPDSDVIAGVAFFLLCYGLMTALAAAAMLLNASRIFNKVGAGDD